MTPAREAIVLPMMFLTVTWLGGLRIASTIRMLPPPLMSLVLAVMLIGSLVHAGALAPQALMSARRSALENLSGLVVLTTLFGASAQIFTLVTPDHGLLNAVFGICFFVQLATTLAGVSERRNLLRSLGVLLGSAFLVRYVILESLYAPEGGVAKRLLTAIVQGASLGAIQYEPAGAATGYVAFFTLALYLFAVTLLPAAPPRGRLMVRAVRYPPVALPLLLIAALAGSACGHPDPETKGDEMQLTQAKERLREDGLRRARVWHQPATPISEFDFTANPASGPGAADEVWCTFTTQKVSGRTPKFHCQTPDGRMLKVKYGETNAELQAELAGTRLLRALGFPADEMFTVQAVHCAGCPFFPFNALQCHERLGADLLCLAGADDTKVRTFTPALIGL